MTADYQLSADFEAWSREYHDDYHHPDDPEPTCRHCAGVQRARQNLVDEQARRDKAAREQAEVQAAGLMLALFLAVVLVTGGLLLGITTAFPFNGRHLAGLVLMGGGSALAIRALWVSRKRAGR